MSSLFDLSGKVAIVTGSSRGIGRAIAERMAEHGARVVVSSRRPEAWEAVAQAIREKGGEAAVILCNISRENELQELVTRTKEQWGGIDVLVCNAAVNPYYGPSAGISDEAFDRIMGTNVRSNVWLANMLHGFLRGSVVVPEGVDLASPFDLSGLGFGSCQHRQDPASLGNHDPP